MRRYELQLWEPDKGGWRTVVTAVDADMITKSARTLAWQTGKAVRVLGPDGLVMHEADDIAAPAASVES